MVPISSLSVADLTVPEGNTGSSNATFTVTLTPAASGTVTVNYATANGTATAGTEVIRLNVDGVPGVDMLDAALIARKVAGLEANP